MFFIAIFNFMIPNMGTAVCFNQERPIFLREQANHAYGVIPYYYSKLFSELPVNLLIPVLITPIYYFGMGFT